MDVLEFRRILTRRWWVILAAVALAVLGSLAYARHQQHLYQASATVFAHPSSVVVKPADINADTGLLTYGTLAETFASLAQSRHMLILAGKDVGVPGQALDQFFSVSASTLPQTTVLEVSVKGPDALTAARLANALVRHVSAETEKYFHTIALTPLDSATTPTTLIQPQTSHDVLYGGLAGLLVGFIIAALSIYRPAPDPSILYRLQTIDPTTASPTDRSRSDIPISAR